MKSSVDRSLLAMVAAIAALMQEKEEMVAIVAAVNACLEEEGIASWKGAPPSYPIQLPVHLGKIRIKAL